MEVRSTFFCRHDAGSHSTSGSKVTKKSLDTKLDNCATECCRWSVQSRAANDPSVFIIDNHREGPYKGFLLVESAY